VKLLFCGDVVGKSGREAVAKYVPMLRAELGLDFVVVNGENAAAGFGITAKICEELYASGVDCITTGNHAWDQREALLYIDSDPRLLRPANFPPTTPGKGIGLYPVSGGRKILVMNVMCRLFMDAIDCPFQATEKFLADNKLKQQADAILIDVHGEATSEKQSLGHFADGKASMVVGSHSHVPTADGWVLPGGTAFQTDAGMCGDYDSIIGMKKEAPILRFLRKIPGDRLTPAEGEGTLCGIYVETDDATGLARHTEPVRLGGKLAQTRPAFSAVLPRAKAAVAE
jgi:metallophosphoesterase (TIGR00282 family)